MNPIVFLFLLTNTFTESSTDSCHFIPHDSHNCLEFWDFRSMEPGCINTKGEFTFIGLTTKYGEDSLIAFDVDQTDLKFAVSKRIWIRRTDGYCTNNCCGTIKRFSRFLFQNIHDEHHCYNMYHHLIFCHNGGICQQGHCKCTSGYTGRHCEHRDCSPDPCQGRGTCSNSASGYTCHCQSGFHGQMCQKDCSRNSCHGHGICRNTSSGYTCTCHHGYHGQKCQLEITTTSSPTTSTISPNNCSPDPCHGHGTCKNSASGYTCHCQSGFYGQMCQKDCSPNSCHGHGICRNTSSGYTCTCHHGYHGQKCQLEITTTSSPSTSTISPTTLKSKNLHPLTLAPFTSPTSRTVTSATSTKAPPNKQCNKLALIGDLVKGVSVSSTGAKGCGGKSADAVLFKHCSAPPLTKWKKGIQVKTNCGTLHYKPVAQWNGKVLSDVAGVLVSCNTTGGTMIRQSCGQPLSLSDVSGTPFDNLYTINWS